MWRASAGEDGEVSTKGMCVNYIGEFYTDRYFKNCNLNTLRGCDYMVGSQWCSSSDCWLTK